MEITCPHCNEVINLVGAAELASEYGLKSNSVQHYRSRGFPDPVLRFGNRYVYLRADVDEFAAQRGRQKVEKAIEGLMHDLEHLSDREKSEARRLLEERLMGPDGDGDGPSKTARKTPTKKRDRSARSPRKGGQDRPA